MKIKIKCKIKVIVLGPNQVVFIEVVSGYWWSFHCTKNILFINGFSKFLKLNTNYQLVHKLSPISKTLNHELPVVI